MRRTLIALLLLVAAGSAFAQCSEITVDDNPVVFTAMETIPAEGVIQQWWYEGYNPNIMDDEITLILQKVDGPDQWSYQMCGTHPDGEEFCLLIMFGSETSGSTAIASESSAEFDVQVTADSLFGEAHLRAGFVRSLCPDDTLWQELAYTLSDDVSVSPLPQSHDLVRVYPNPFNPQTQIAFTLPASQNVSLSITDLLGRSVREYYNNTMLSAGEHIVRFDANGLAGGVYLYHLTLGDELRSGSMTLIK